MGQIKLSDVEPEFDSVSVMFRVVKGRNTYPSQHKNGIRSKKMGQYDGHSIKFEYCKFNKNEYLEKDDLIKVVCR